MAIIFTAARVGETLMIGRALAFAVLIATATAPAHAATDDWTACMTAGGKPEGIVSACTRALKDNADAPPRQRALFLEARSDALMRALRLSEAIVGYTAAIRLQPRDMEAYRSRGAAWLAVGRYALAVQDLSTALRYRNPQADETTVSDVYYARAAAFHALRRSAEYRADCAAARRLDHREPKRASDCP